MRDGAVCLGRPPVAMAAVSVAVLGGTRLLVLRAALEHGSSPRPACPYLPVQTFPTHVSNPIHPRHVATADGR
jgi:hypothetical protein